MKKKGNLVPFVDNKNDNTGLKTTRDCEDENRNERGECCRIMIILYYEMSVITCKKKRVLICL